ncbi:MAG: YcgN family cysteine cluster protein [Anaerolineaceae bacterium]|jgi:hypothetical protein|nr:MAG: YcgN family cysteine cluster protein [Anaerolineaceae bacterium]
MTWFDPARIESLDLLNRAEWDLLCDKCGICCLYKLRDPHDLKTRLTRVACRYLDIETCTCRVYEQQHDRMPTCIQLTTENIGQLDWLPETCAYRRIAERKPLPWWHPLRSGKRDLVHKLRVSIRGAALSEKDVDLNDLNRYIIHPW